eukprot:1010381-Amphidinium_carterae.1
MVASVCGIVRRGPAQCQMSPKFHWPNSVHRHASCLACILMCAIALFMVWAFGCDTAENALHSQQ